MRLPAALLALLVVTAGCSVLSEDRPPSDQRALDVRDRALAVVDDVSTYRYSLDGRVTASDGSDRRTIAISGTGVVSRPEQRLVSNVTTDDETRAVYVDGRTVTPSVARRGTGTASRTRASPRRGSS